MCWVCCDNCSHRRSRSRSRSRSRDHRERRSRSRDRSRRSRSRDRRRRSRSRDRGKHRSRSHSRERLRQKVKRRHNSSDAEEQPVKELPVDPVVGHVRLTTPAWNSLQIAINVTDLSITIWWIGSACFVVYSENCTFRTLSTTLIVVCSLLWFLNLPILFRMCFCALLHSLYRKVLFLKEYAIGSCKIIFHFFCSVQYCYSRSVGLCHRLTVLYCIMSKELNIVQIPSLSNNAAVILKTKCCHKILHYFLTSCDSLIGRYVCAWMKRWSWNCYANCRHFLSTDESNPKIDCTRGYVISFQLLNCLL